MQYLLKIMLAICLINASAQTVALVDGYPSNEKKSDEKSSIYVTVQDNLGKATMQLIFSFFISSIANSLVQDATKKDGNDKNSEEVKGKLEMLVNGGTVIGVNLVAVALHKPKDRDRSWSEYVREVFSADNLTVGAGSGLLLHVAKNKTR